MFAHHVSVNGMRRDADVLADQSAKAGCVQNRAGADDSPRRQLASRQTTSVMISTGLEATIKTASGA